MKSILFFVIMGASPAWAAAPNACPEYQASVSGGTAAQKLKKFIDFNWKYSMREFPEWSTYVGLTEYNDRWNDNSPEAQARREKEDICRLQALKKIDRKSLKAVDVVNYDLLLNRAELSIEAAPFDSEFLPLDHMGGVHSDVIDMMTAMPTATVKDVENMIARLEKVPALVKQTEYWLREGSKRKITPVKMFLARVPGQIDKILTDKVEDSPLYRPFADLRGSYGEEQKAGLQKRVRETIAEKVFPSFKALREYLEKEYIPGARESISWKEMPNGAAWYALMVKSQTTTSMTPAQIHDLGLREVERLSAEMAKVRAEVKFKGDEKAFNKFLLSDKRFFYTDKEALLTGYRDIAKRIDPELTKMFKTLPRLPYGVRPIPDFKAKESAAGYYYGGSLDTGRPGYVEMNTYDLKSRPKWAMEALMFHEGVPGHHFQIAIAQEIKDLPEFRRRGGYTAFVEGWGLYAESLGDEMGFYKDPYSKYGQLSYEMWRAVRLVVDTGMHFHGWSRQQSIDYMAAKVPKTTLEVEQEIDRYITWPGQALAYKIGQLKFRELREKAKSELGEKFDVREYHDEALKNGALPLEVLEKNIGEWILSVKKRKPKST